MSNLPKFVRRHVDRHGRERFYLRKPGQASVALPPHGSPEFDTAYKATLAAEPPPISTARTDKGTISGLVAAYYESQQWRALAPVTQVNFRRDYERFREAHGAKPVKSLEPRHVDKVLAAYGDRTGAAKALRKRLNTLFAFAVRLGWCADNPVSKAERVKHRVIGYRTWTEADIAAFRKRWPVGAPVRLAFEILLNTGLRRADAVRLGWNHVVDGEIVVTTSKSRHSTELTIPIHEDLWAVLKDCLRDRPTFIVTGTNVARTAKGFTKWIREAAHATGPPSNSSPHGLRKAICRRLADADCDAMTIMSITGHKNMAEIMPTSRRGISGAGRARESGR